VCLVVLVSVSTVRADVKTTEKTTLKIEGLLGKFLGGAAKDGITSTVALKGVRKSSGGDRTGEIIDLTEEKLYRLDIRKKEYRVVTFAQLRKEWQDAKAEAEKNAKQLRESQGETGDKPGVQYEYTVDVKETGQKKPIAGHDTREVVLTLTGKVKDMTLEEGGGYVMTQTMWLAPRIAALDEVWQFQMKYFKAVMGEEPVAAMQELAVMFAMFAAAQPMMQKMQAEGQKLQGTPLHTTMLLERVKSAEEMKAATSQQQSSGGGIGGMLARKMMSSGPPKARTTVLTSVHEYLSIATSATDADVAIPAGFKEKK
jgi:hypothetical protein